MEWKNKKGKFKPIEKGGERFLFSSPHLYCASPFHGLALSPVSEQQMSEKGKMKRLGRRFIQKVSCAHPSPENS